MGRAVDPQNIPQPMPLSSPKSVPRFSHNIFLSFFLPSDPQSDVSLPADEGWDVPSDNLPPHLTPSEALRKRFPGQAAKKHEPRRPVQSSPQLFANQLDQCLFISPSPAVFAISLPPPSLKAIRTGPRLKLPARRSRAHGEQSRPWVPPSGDHRRGRIGLTRTELQGLCHAGGRETGSRIWTRGRSICSRSPLAIAKDGADWCRAEPVTIADGGDMEDG